MSLVIRDLHKSYTTPGNQRLDILRGLNAEIRDGEIVAIVGKSGSGKSTLLSLLAGLDQAESGSITIGGEKLAAMPQDELSRWRGRKLGIVFQQFHLLSHLSAFENVLLPLEILGRADGERVRGLLEEMGLAARAGHFPSQLSGGEAQRVAIARALVAGPSLLLADEPSGNLDVDTGEQVMEAFFRQVRKTGTTSILVTHNPELATRCDRSLVLEHGVLLPK